MQLFVRGQQTHTLEVTGTETCEELKMRVAALEGIPAIDQVMLYAGSPLENEDTLLSREVPDLATVEVVGRLLGGKVHGSLARAGKVKGQTPKVEAQEKKKKRTGRAKRRMLYNRRFVNVVPTFGKRRGPNSNS
ncbi:ubiquitin-like FUBI-ribosomal protein eS30 fusion protein [Amphiura filiformis]|uniref:ubiquitin-like FUBI-ribosomal protein eS30 fusion protein n=1 Tax=Amphiura filiformis TaxID=82378 RepID=UPI003B215D88